MANYSVNRAKHASLAANTVDVITLSYTGSLCRVRNRSGVELWFTIDGSVPTVAGDDTYYLGPTENVIVTSNGPVRQVKLIANRTPVAYSVEVY